MLLCFEHRQHPDRGLAITYPTGHGKRLFGGHKDILAAFRYKMSFSIGKTKQNINTHTHTQAHRFDDLISVPHLFAGRCEQQARGCVCTTSHRPPPGTPKRLRPTSPGAIRGRHGIADSFAECMGIRSWIIRTKAICRGHDSSG